MKGVIPIISIILILIIVTILASLMWTWIFGLTTDITEEGETSISHLSERLSSCILLDSINHNTIYIRNCGQGVITNDTLNIFIDGKEFNFSMTPESIEQGELATITMPIWGMSIGDHTLKIVNPKTELVKRIEAELHDSAVLTLDFDEGEGDTVYDKSGYDNDGTIIDNEGDQWTVGKYGSALNFDGVDDYVDLGSNAIVSNQAKFTVSLWFKTTSSNWENMYGEGNTGSGVDYSLVCTSASKLWGCVFGGSVYSCLESVQSVDDGEWHHVAYVKRASNDYELYLDGASVDTDTTDVSTPTIDNVRIGSINIGGTDDFFNGAIDSVRIYNKVLTPNEILILKKK